MKTRGKQGKTIRNWQNVFTHWIQKYMKHPEVKLGKSVSWTKAYFCKADFERISSVRIQKKLKR